MAVIDLNKTGIMTLESTGLADITTIDEKNKIFQPKAMELNKISRNNALYQGNDVVRGLKAPHIIEWTRRGVWHSELEHPKRGCSQERFLEIDDTRTCGTIMKWWLDGDSIMLKYKISEPLGYILWDWIMGGANMAFSIRAYTPNFIEKVNEKGQKYLLKHGNMFIVTFDAVKTPGFETATIADITKYDARDNDLVKNGDLKTNSKESSPVYFESWEHKFCKEEFDHMLKTCENFNIIKDMFSLEDDKIDIIYTEDRKVIVNKENNTNESLILGLDTYEIMKTLSTKKHF